MNVYVTIGNSDDGLTQARWSEYCAQVEHLITGVAPTVYGIWFSRSDSRWQNACFSFEAYEGAWADHLKSRLADIAHAYEQKSVAWVEGTVEFIEGI